MEAPKRREVIGGLMGALGFYLNGAVQYLVLVSGINAATSTKSNFSPLEAAGLSAICVALVIGGYFVGRWEASGARWYVWILGIPTGVVFLMALYSVAITLIR